MALAFGSGFAVALDGCGHVHTSGDNTHGQNGNATDGLDVGRFEVARLDTPATAVSAGYSHAAAVDAAGRLWTWGFGVISHG